MKKSALLLTLPFLILFSQRYACYCQDTPNFKNNYSVQLDTITIIHHYYSATFDKKLHYPVYVHWVLKKTDLTCATSVGRTNNFHSDPMLPEDTDLDASYSGTHYDRGHNCDALDNECNLSDEKECFYYSNMTPQTPGLNRGNWKVLEAKTRSLAKQYNVVDIQCGSFGKTQVIGVVAVPTYCWKVVKYNGVIEAYIFTNEAQPKMYPITITQLKQLTGLKIK